MRDHMMKDILKKRREKEKINARERLTGGHRCMEALS